MGTKRPGRMKIVPLLLLAGQALANWNPGTWDVGSHDGSMPKCDYKKYPAADFNPDDFAATGHGCNNFPLRLCEHDENLWPGGVHHNNMTCEPYTPPKHKNCSALNLNGFWDPACLPETNNCDNGTNVNCNIDVKHHGAQELARDHREQVLMQT